MTEIINMAKVQAATSMVGAYYPFPRAAALQQAVSDCITDHYIGQNLGKPFEASGVFVTGLHALARPARSSNFCGRSTDRTPRCRAGCPSASSR